MQDNGDATKQLQFELAGLTTATTRTLTVPDVTGTLALLQGAQNFTGNTIFSNVSGTFGNGAVTGTINLGSGVTATGNTKTVNIGTGGAAGSTTTINIGPTAGAGAGTVLCSVPFTLVGITADPSTPADGTLWYNATTGQLKAQVGGVAKAIDSQRDIGWLTPVSGDYMLTTTGAGGGATATVAGVADRIEMFPFTPRADTPITGVAVNVTTLVASALAKVQFYDEDANGRPNNLLLETGTIDLGTAGVRTVAAALTLRQGKTYWIAIRHSSTATLSSWPLTATPDINGGQPVTTARKTVRRTLTFATGATSTWGRPASEIFSTAAVAIWLKV